MAKSAFDSSDSVRTRRPLKYALKATLRGGLDLEMGGRLEDVSVTYETYGRLNRRGDNAVLICHALSGDSHVARHHRRDDPGWWDVAVGPGKPIDTNKYFVICPNALGGCRGTTGPSSRNPATGKPYGADFPTITTGDIVRVQRRLVQRLGIRKLRAVAGGSMGGHQALTWATRFPDQVEAVVALATSARLTAQALAFDVIGRNSILRDPQFHGGQYYGREGPSVGLALARMLGHITYLSPQAMAEKFEADRLRPRNVPTEFEKRFSVGSYLAYQGDKFVERFDANSYIKLSLAMDLFNLGATPEELAANLGRSRCRWLVVSFSSDWLFPAEQSREIVETLLSLNKPVSYCNVTSSCGHDAFLLPDDLPLYGEMVRAFLDPRGPARSGRDGLDDDFYAQSPASIFHPQRLDYDLIAELIPPSASVLDLGCGRGGLLTRLRNRGNERLAGIELDESSVLACFRRGLDVTQADLNHGLAAFREAQFDFVVLSHTLQAVRNVEQVIADMLRVSGRCIVSFPNFGYHKLTRMLVHESRAPESPGLLRYKWYDSPNIRFLTIRDFEEFCREHGITIHRRIALDTEAGVQIRRDTHRRADMAIFVISQKEKAPCGPSCCFPAGWTASSPRTARRGTGARSACSSRAAAEPRRRRSRSRPPARR
jgi:homoserine O-acetyltransferase